ncbi:uncharacterized protein LOC131467293 [Solea solea]|uniref:uncharacterized protein LOC131467293 n=1 Tax=Solea solea TaxID=90069 RepID=UPI00272C61CE|nr:uncharacterized protein LOC131467293 [Solea solea]
MPHSGMNFIGRRRGTHHNTFKSNYQVSCQVPGTGLINGVTSHDGCPPTATGISKSMPVDIPKGSKPQHMVNGHINHRYKGSSTNAAPLRTFREQGRMISAVTGASAAGRVSNGDISHNASVNGATSPDTVELTSNSDQMGAEPCLSATAVKSRPRRKTFRRKNRATEVMMPHQEEDWENEVQEVMLTDWEKMCFGFTPYGPEDLLHFSVRDMTIKQLDVVDLPVTANYSPAIHHPHPIKWSCFKFPTEPDQFADADE